jgi:hypothetical protein
MSNAIPQFELGLLRQILAQSQAQTCLLKALVRVSGIEAAELAQLEAEVQQLIDANKDTDIAGFAPTLESITRQPGDTTMAKVHSFKSGAGTLLDDDKGVIHANPLMADGVTPAALGTMIPAYAADVSTFGTLDPTVDPTGATCGWTSVKGQAGVTTVTISGTNADGTTATGDIVITTSLDPAEADVASFGPTLDSVTKQ